MTCAHGLDREIVDCLQCENEEQARRANQAVPVPAAELERLRAELLQCRSKLALAAESAAGDSELIAELVAALKAMIKDLEFRATVIDPDEPVLDIGNGVLEQARAAIAKATQL